jgi:hypothetical protein
MNDDDQYHTIYHERGEEVVFACECEKRRANLQKKNIFYSSLAITDREISRIPHIRVE